MEIPTQVIIGTVTYAITIDEEQWIRIEHRLQKTGHYGHAMNLEATIYLNPGLAPSMVRLTLWHEILHALFESVMGSPDWEFLPTSTKDDREEAVIRSLEHATLAVIIDNPSVIGYLMSSE